MQKRWLQSVIIFVVIIIFAIAGYLLLKKYNPNPNVAVSDDWVIFTVEKPGKITLSLEDVKL